ncbi:hypothetical protein [Paraburkholderia fungorum]|uniref:hypothetical protein n=1 Tax=Paraburkholderia fungorum TaxID=134537 RepID=UPI0038BC77AC
MLLEKTDCYITGEDVRAQLVKLDAALRALDAANCDEQKKVLLSEFMLFKQLDCDVCKVLARAWTTEVLVQDSVFVGHIRTLAEENCNTPWVLSGVNWVRAAEVARLDWCAVELGGMTYWVR